MRGRRGPVPVRARVLQHDRGTAPQVAAIVAAVKVTAQRRHAVSGGPLEEAQQERRDPLVEQDLVVELQVGLVAVPYQGLAGLGFDHQPVIGNGARIASSDGHRTVQHGGCELVLFGVPAVQPERHEPVARSERPGDVGHFRDRCVDGPYVGGGRHSEPRAPVECRLAITVTKGRKSQVSTVY